MIIKVFRRPVRQTVSQLLSVLILSGASYAYAANDYWQSPLGQASIQSSNTEANQRLSLRTDGEFDVTQPRVDQAALEFTQALTDSSSLTLEYANAQQQRNMVFGFTNNNLSLSFISGSGKNYSELGGAYSGIDPYVFHGGVNQKFRYTGYAADYGFGKFGHLQFGQAKVEADGLSERKARYMEWSNNRVFARATQFSRDSESIGNGFDGGIAIGTNKQLAFQSMRLDNGRSLDRIRFQFNGKKTRQYWVDFSTHRNPLFRDNDDYRVMFSFKTLLGTSSLTSYAAEPVVEEGAAKTKKKGKGINRAVFIGVGVAAAAGLASSGSSSSDTDDRFLTQRDAAFEVLNGINPQSVRENREYGGWVFVNPDGSFSSTNPVRGEAASVRLPNPALVIPSGSRQTASYHTHAAFDPRFDNENFSPTDLELDRREMVDGFLATPGGQFKFHDFRADTVTTLGSIAN